MDIATETITPIAIVLFAAGILAWGYARARPYGKIGLLSWLQSVSVTAPWLVFFGLLAAGIYINLALELLVIILSIIVYIGLGRRLRQAAQDPKERADLQNLLENKLGTDQPSKSQDPQDLEVKNLEADSDSSTDSESNTSLSSASESGKIGNSSRELPPKLGNRKAALEFPAIPDEDLRQIQNIFGIDTFFCTETIPYQSGAIFKGNLRGEPDPSYGMLASRLEAVTGDRYRLFLVPDPDGKPVVVVLPRDKDPQPLTQGQQLLALGLCIATVVTSLETAGIFLGFDLFSDFSRWPETLPLALGIWAVLLIHELGHRVMASRYGVRLSPPFFLPTWQIGSFGAITRFESLMPNRSVLFDVSIAGPLAGGLFSFALLLVGLGWSNAESLFQIPTEFFRGSVLVGVVAKGLLGQNLNQALVAVHPLVILGWLGLVVNAINLMPAGQLDGGRAVQAIYGRKIAGRTTIATLVVLAIATFANPLALYWAIIILVLQRDLERPSLNEIREPNDARALISLLSLLMVLLTLLPLTPSLALRLGIGG
ncbi:site-2 protease family protein [Geitlerinema sp. P-1104]|uniref:site-2 protease family protein n=1 Tax=Geitlerinema sp. P-1104 TaxID=2546230 RepID=UPI001476AFD2|nr:site-2 protease family protein [Geitlerinema sp. P-1104]NMG58538.1 site-2 protease family protein [Geitlerinema sp. P-1104]